MNPIPKYVVQNSLREVEYPSSFDTPDPNPALPSLGIYTVEQLTPQHPGIQNKATVPLHASISYEAGGSVYMPLELVASRTVAGQRGSGWSLDSGEAQVGVDLVLGLEARNHPW